MEINNKSKYIYKTITYIFIGSLLPGISIANPAEKENLYYKKIELVEIEVKDNVTKTYLKKRTSTATKTDTRIRDIPQSISVVTEEQIKDQSILGLTDAIKYSPGVMAGQGEGNRDSVWFRGNQSTSDLFVDGVRDDVQYYRDLYNIDRVEVLMGPNGMIFGRSGVGGVINRVIKEANWETKNEFRVQGGAYEHKRSSIDFNQAITNSLAIRVNGMIEDSGSFRQGVESERKAINPTFTFKPSDKTKIIVGMEYFNDKRTSDRGIPSVANGLQSYAYATNRSTFFGNASQSPNEAIVKNGYAIIEHAFDNGFSFKNHTRFSDYDKYYQNVYANSQVRLDGTVTIDGYYDNTQRQNFFNQTDLTYNLKTGSISHRLLAGLEIGFQENQNYRIVNNGTDPTPLASNPYALLTWQSTKSRNTATDIYNQAVYFQDQISLNEQYQIIAGIRYDQFRTKFNDQVIVANSANVNDQFLSPRVGLVYKPIEPVSIYTNYSLSYLPRTGEQLTSLTSSIKSFDPEKISNIEVGLKYDLLQSFSISSAIYRLQRSNMTITDPSNSSNTIIVDGQVTKGFELGVKVAMARNLPITIAGPKNNENWFKENSWIYGYPKLSILNEPSNEVLRQIYTSYTIFLHPSELEAGHPNLTLLEAAACGLPILGWIETDTTFHGLWRAPRDFNEMLRGLDTIINEYGHYRQRALQTANELSWLNRSKELIALHERYFN